MKKVPLTRGLHALVDDRDFPALMRFKWHILECRAGMYAKRNGPRNGLKNNRTAILMHRVLAEAKRGEVVDHIDHNTLNNQKKNLRACTNSENLANRKGPSAASTSGFLGVYPAPSGRYRVQLGVRGRSIYIGHFRSVRAASAAYASASVKYYGEFSPFFRQKNKRSAS